jgi:multidrug resistance efflux pump
MKSRVRIIVILLILAACGGTLLYLHPWSRTTGTPEAITGNGIVEATEVDISAVTGGRVVSLPVKEGDDVVAGQLIATLESDTQRGGVDQAQANLQVAQAALQALQAGTRTEDLRRLKAQVTAAGAQRDAAQRALEQAKAQRDLVVAGPRTEQIAQLQAAYETAKARYDLVKAGSRDEDIAQAKDAVTAAQATLDQAESDQKRVAQLGADGAVSTQRVDQARTARDLAAAQLSAAQNRLAEVTAGPRPEEIAQAQQQMEQASQALQQAQKGARPQEKDAANAGVAQAQAALNAASAQVQAAQAALDLGVAGARKEDVDAAKARVEQAQAALDVAHTAQGQTTVVSPSAGRVTLRNLEPGELATPGLPIVRIYRLDQVWTRVYVPDSQIGLVRVGQTATVTADALPGRTFTGTVSEIAQSPEFTPKNVQTKEERAKLVWAVKVRITNVDDALKPGMPADAAIAVGAGHGGQ